MVALNPSGLFIATLVLLWTLPTCLAASVPSFIRASNSPGDTNFYDEFGRVRIFHGSNRVQKGGSWYFPEMLTSDSEFKLMKKLGFNVIRLGYMWTGVNPAPGVFNQTYVDAIKAIVQKMAERCFICEHLGACRRRTAGIGTHPRAASESSRRVPS